MELLTFVQDNSVVILGALLAASEVLALVPSIKSNGIFQLVVNMLKTLSGKQV